MQFVYYYKSSDGMRHDGEMESPDREEVFIALRRQGRTFPPRRSAGRRLFAVAFSALVCAAGAADLSEIRKALLFEAPLDGTADAVFAQGEAKALAVRDVEFVAGRNGRKAARFTSRARSQIAYAAPGNLPREEGTVVFWYRQTAEAGSRAALFSGEVPFNSRFGTASPYIWFWERSGFRFDSGSDVDFYRSVNYPYDGQWHFVAVTWNGDEFGIYRDGRISSHIGLPMVPAKKSATGRKFTYSKMKPMARFSLGTRLNGETASFDGELSGLRLYARALDAEEAAAVWRADGGRPPPDPDYAALFRDDPPNPHEGPARPVAGEIPRDDLELLYDVKCDAVPTNGLFTMLGGAPAVKTCAGVRYLEFGPGEACRFAYGFDLDPDAPLHLIEIDYPDDACRTMDFIVQQRANEEGLSLAHDYTLQVGVATGKDAHGVGCPNSNRILTHRCPYWTRSARVALVGWNCRRTSVAIAGFRVYRVKSGRLPDAGVVEPPAAADGWHRTLGVYFEDCAVGYDFVGEKNGGSAQGLRTTFERLAATMKFAGQNLLAYPAAWYCGRITADSYNPRGHARDFMSGVYEIFDREGLQAIPVINQDLQRFPEHGLVTETSLTNGMLHGLSINFMTNGFPRNRGVYATRFNFAHPDVQAEMERNVDDFIAQGLRHKSFKGVGLHLKYNSLCWAGTLLSGYNDYAIDAFEKAKGVKVPVDRADPLRAKAYAEWIWANALEKYVEWRCDLVTGFWIRQADKLRAKRPDLKLYVNLFTMLDPHFDRFFEADYIRKTNLIGGLDAHRLAAACPNVMVSEAFSPADYRCGLCVRVPSPDHYLRLADIHRRPEFYDSIAGTAYPMVHLHDRYFESAIGAPTNPWSHRKQTPLQADWLVEHPWRVTTVNPAGVHAMEHFVGPFRYNDLLGITKGGFLIGTYGMEAPLARFARYFRALPAAKMADVGGTDVVKVRACTFKGRRYLYVANTAETATTFALDLPAGATDLATGEKMPTRTSLALAPWDFRSFSAPID